MGRIKAPSQGTLRKTEGPSRPTANPLRLTNGHPEAGVTLGLEIALFEVGVHACHPKVYKLHLHPCSD